MSDEPPKDSDDKYAQMAQFQLQLLQFQGKMESVLNSFDISLKQFQALLIIKTYPGGQAITVRHLAESMGVHPSSTSGLLARLEANGWIERKLDLNDRRIIRVVLTLSGEELLENIFRLDFDHANDLRTQFQSATGAVDID